MTTKKAVLSDPKAFGLTRAAYSVHETLSLLSIGRTTLYRLVQDQKLKPGKIGRKTLFFAPDIAHLLQSIRTET